MGNDIELQHFDHLVTTRSGAAIWYVQSIDLPGFFSSVVTALESAGSDSWLCQALADHLDFCELAARIACVKSLRSDLADRDLTATERATLDRLAADPCDWIRNEAKCALNDLADPLPDQVAAHDGADPIEANVAGTKIRYLGQVASIAGKFGELTGKASQGEGGEKYREIDFDGDKWQIPFDCPLELAEDFAPELRTFEARGVTIEDHGRLNYIRTNAKGAQRDRAGALLVKLAGVAK